MSVFEGKMECFLEKVNELDIFGSNQGIMKSVEEQKGTLLHAHCLLRIVERPDIQELEKIISPQFQIQHKIFGHLTDNAKIEKTKDCDDILKQNC